MMIFFSLHFTFRKFPLKFMLNNSMIMDGKEENVFSFGVSNCLYLYVMETFVIHSIVFLKIQTQINKVCKCRLQKYYIILGVPHKHISHSNFFYNYFSLQQLPQAVKILTYVRIE